ncbi:hypothetical protein Y032_0122g1106 [Ancylostoma ceylanicum]|uniref:Ankyrin repeat protein n=1 Tax=Ancylostoma ceylanicum TaxID=53326 RepID=A0A016TA45_9BILA|nr:hypothetical protein Y032_0122g1106 [Ancylostoma ceylanicum]
MGKKKNRVVKASVKHRAEEKIQKEEFKEVDSVEEAEELSDHECSTQPSTSGIVLKLAAKEFGYASVKKLLESGADIKVRYREVDEIPHCDDCGGPCTCPRQMTLYERTPQEKRPPIH